MQARSVDLFPTRLWVFDLPELLPLHAGWIDAIQRWREAQPTAAGRSNRHGWNSDKTVFAQALFAPLRDAANQAFSHAFGQMALHRDLSFGLEAWVNLHDPGGFNTLHLHPNVLLSGCYYLQVPDGAGPLVFRDPRPGPLLVAFQGDGPHCKVSQACSPKPGQLLVFPNWLDHRVEPNDGDMARIAVAMNALRV